MTILKLVWRSRHVDAPRCAHFPTDICSLIQEGVITVEKWEHRGASVHMVHHTLSLGRNKHGHNNSAPFTDSCRFLISSGLKFTALCTILPHSVQSALSLFRDLCVLGSILGAIRDLDKSTERCLTTKSSPDSNPGHTDYQATTEPLSQVGLLIWDPCK